MERLAAGLCGMLVVPMTLVILLARQTSWNLMVVLLALVIVWQFGVRLLDVFGALAMATLFRSESGKNTVTIAGDTIVTMTVDPSTTTNQAARKSSAVHST